MRRPATPSVRVNFLSACSLEVVGRTNRTLTILTEDQTKMKSHQNPEDPKFGAKTEFTDSVFVNVYGSMS